MVAISFQEQFVPMLLAGTKRQTLRRTARCRPGDRLQIYTGLRTKACRKLGEAICLFVDYCALRDSGLTFGNKALHPPTADGFAQADGFKDYDAMIAWFHGKYGPGEFVGRIIKW
jgi:hypothetical protein